MVMWRVCPSSLMRSSRSRQGLLDGGGDRLGSGRLRLFAPVEDVATVDLDPELSHPAGLPRHRVPGRFQQRRHPGGDRLLAPSDGADVNRDRGHQCSFAQRTSSGRFTSLPYMSMPTRNAVPAASRMNQVATMRTTRAPIHSQVGAALRAMRAGMSMGAKKGIHDRTLANIDSGRSRIVSMKMNGMTGMK